MKTTTTTDYTMVKTAISTLKTVCGTAINWDSQSGLEIEYTMRLYADRGFFEGKTQAQIDNFLTHLVLIAKAGFDDAKTQIRNNVNF